jgi:hypothetical protein
LDKETGKKSKKTKGKKEKVEKTKDKAQKGDKGKETAESKDTDKAGSAKEKGKGKGKGKEKSEDAKSKKGKGKKGKASFKDISQVSETEEEDEEEEEEMTDNLQEAVPTETDPAATNVPDPSAPPNTTQGEAQPGVHGTVIPTIDLPEWVYSESELSDHEGGVRREIRKYFAPTWENAQNLMERMTHSLKITLPSGLVVEVADVEGPPISREIKQSYAARGKKSAP